MMSMTSQCDTRAQPCRILYVNCYNGDLLPGAQ
jgi:hypothetical protein